MKEVILFNGINALDFQDIRDNVIRIPEVSARIREAQEVWEALTHSNFSFYNFLLSEDTTYLSNIKIKSLITSIVQVGLYDRYVRKFGLPDYVVGAVNGDSPLMVCLGKITFEDMILSSQAAKPSLPLMAVPKEGQPVLAGVSLTEVGIFCRNRESNQFEREVHNQRDLAKIINFLIEDRRVTKLTNIGPGTFSLESFKEELAMRDVQIVESIDADPMLSWFWVDTQKGHCPISLAQ